MKKEIQFETRELTIISTDIILNPSYREPAYEMCIYFDDESSNMRYILHETDDTLSDIEAVTNLFKILGCQKASEMDGRKLTEIRARRKNSKEESWSEWKTIGYGDRASDKFIDIWRGDFIFPRKRLEKMAKNFNWN